jgi:hypothetical protein
MRTYLLVYINNGRLEVHDMPLDLDGPGTCVFSEKLLDRDVVVRTKQATNFASSDGISMDIIS